MTKQSVKSTATIVAKYAPYVIPSVLLLGSIFYFSWYANIFFGNVQDAILYPYLVQGFQLNDVILPGSHTNILKFPLFIFQAIIPYNPLTLFLVNLSLVLLSVGAWSILLVKIFGKKFLPLIFTLTSAFLLSSILLQTNLAETTIRNIEYPIGLALILLIGHYLAAKKFTKKSIIWTVVIGILFTLSLAGDSFMLYAFVAPILAMLVIYTLQTQKINKKVVYAFVFTIAIVLASIVIRKFVAFSGIAVLHFADSFNAKILPYDQFFPALSHASEQLFMLSGGDIAGRAIAAKNAIYFVNFLFVFVGIAGLLYAFIRSCRLYYKKKPANAQNNFVLSTLFLSFGFTFFAYILSGLALILLADGSLADASNARYITLLPFLIIAGVCILLDQFYNSKIRTILAIVIFGAILISIPAIRLGSQGLQAYANNNHQVIDNVKDAALANDVSFILSGDTLGSTVRFWSNDAVKYASVLQCNQFMTHNTRLSWYVPTGIPTALLVDRTGLDAQYWTGCTTEKLEVIYGTPNKIVFVDNPAGSEPIELWIYDHDVRGRTVRSN